MLYLQPCQVLWEPGSLLVKTWRAVNTCCWRSVWPSLTGFHSVKLPKNKMIHAAIKRYIPPLQWCSVNDSSVPNLTFNHTNTCLSAERQVPWRLCCFRWSLLVEAKLLWICEEEEQIKKEFGMQPVCFCYVTSANNVRLRKKSQAACWRSEWDQ